MYHLSNPKHDYVIYVVMSSRYRIAHMFSFSRFFPIGVDVSRILQKDVVIGDYQIPAGVSIVDIHPQMCVSNFQEGRRIFRRIRS